MTSTKRSPGEFDCYANADDDEPMFVLLARDVNAPHTVRFWAELYKLIKAGTQDGLLTQKQADKIKDARKCADDMQKWREVNT